MLKGHATVRSRYGKCMVLLEGTWFFTDEVVGTYGFFRACQSDQYAYMTCEEEEEIYA